MIKAKLLLLSVGIIFSTQILLAQENLNLKVGSYNIRYDNEDDREKGNGWNERLPVISSIINWEEPDVFGAQEVLVDQLKDMNEKLTDYEYYGVGRADGKEKGEFAPIFFQKDKYELKDSGEFWLSETPNEPSKGWDAALPRICSWIELKDKETKKTFWFFNLHMDHKGTKAREESSQLVLKKIKEIANDESAILTGDFNVDQKNEIYDILQGSDIIFDSFEETSKKMAWNGTFNAFDTGLWTDRRIDHIFVTNDIDVDKYAVLTETYRSEKDTGKKFKNGDFSESSSSEPADVRLPSDHFPIFARIKLSSE